MSTLNLDARALSRLLRSLGEHPRLAYPMAAGLSSITGSTSLPPLSCGGSAHTKTTASAPPGPARARPGRVDRETNEG
jgi:hypothetical protein